MAASISVLHRSPANELDHLIRESALTLLEGSGYEPLGKIDCQVNDGVIELFGSVPSFYMKQMAQAVALRVDRARGVKNRVHVR